MILDHNTGKPNRFNIRVYFILLNNSRDALLVSDEIIRGNTYTKLPGGGLEFGEGLAECVQREAMEELGQAVKIIRHFYTTDFFIQSAFRTSDQVISIYYVVELVSTPKFKTSVIKNNFTQSVDDEESFRWICLDQLREDDFDFPADRVVAKMLIDGQIKQ